MFELFFGRGVFDYTDFISVESLTSRYSTSGLLLLLAVWLLLMTGVKL